MISNVLNTGYEALGTALFASFIAQLFKFALYTLKNRHINFKIFTTTGGMPSAHSAMVMGLTTSVGIIGGYDSLIFNVCLGYALIIMYDAAGLRRAAGKTAASLNRMMADFYEHNVEAIGPKLKELLGHTPVEVFVGALLGIGVSYFVHYCVLM